MPIELINEPPYYKFIDGVKLPFKRVQTNVGAFSTAGTALTNIWSYTIPKNTLAKTGDQLQYNLILESDSAVPNAAIDFQWKITGGTSTGYNLTPIGPTDNKTTMIITRTADTEATLLLLGNWNLLTTPVIVKSVLTAQDFTIDIFTRWRLRAPTSGVLTTKYHTVDLITIKN